MSRKYLAPLVLAAIEDSETGVDSGAGAVLSDALEERGETWETYARLMGVGHVILYRDRLKAIAAVLLFGDWSTDPWPLIQRCWWPEVEIRLNGRPLGRLPQPPRRPARGGRR